MTYDELKDYLSDESINISKLDTKRMVKVLDKLDNPQKKLNIIHVVGTNGKGSTSTMLANILKCAGVKAGLFNSPYITELTEYIKLDLVEIDVLSFTAIGSYLVEILNKYNLTLTHFEFVTILSILYFVENKAEIVIYEAGLGGVGDATDVFNSSICTIATKIDFDHTAFLGNTIEQIVDRKLGITKPDEYIVSQDVLLSNINNLDELSNYKMLFDKHNACSYIEEYVSANDRKLYSKKENLNILDDKNTIFTYGDYKNINLGNNALYQIKNAITAITAFELLAELNYVSVSDLTYIVKQGLENFSLKARFEKVLDKPLVYIDGGHNPDCIRNLVESLSKVLYGKKCIFVTGVMKDKEYDEMYSLLGPLAKTFLCIDNSIKRALPAHELMNYLNELGYNAIDLYDSAIAAAYIKNYYHEDDIIVYVGSLYLSDAFRNDILTTFDNKLLVNAEGDIINRLTSKAFFSKNYSLDDMNYLLGLINNPEEKLNVIHIAGTNGKGSTCKMISEVLQAANFKTGLFTSPFLEVFNERIRLNGENISADWLVAVGKMLFRLTKSEKIELNQFALVTLIAIIYYAIIGTDYVVLETGLGGTYDPTNIFKAPIATGITNIGLDHTAVLGDSLIEIAKVKAGIIKNNVPIVLYPVDSEIKNVIEEIAKEHNAAFNYVDYCDIMSFEAGSINTIIFKNKSYDIPLLGKFQAYNASVAIEICTIILTDYGYSDIDVYDIIKKGLIKATWKGRLEKVHDNPLVYVDGGHNPQCIENITEYANERWNKSNLVFISGFMVDKDYKSMINLLASKASKVILIPVDNPRAAKYDHLAREAEKYSNVSVSNNVLSAYNEALDECTKDSVIIYCGSIYMLSEVYKIFK